MDGPVTAVGLQSLTQYVVVANLRMKQLLRRSEAAGGKRRRFPLGGSTSTGLAVFFHVQFPRCHDEVACLFSRQHQLG